MKKWNAIYTMTLVAACGIIGASIGIMMNTRGVFLTPIADYYQVGRGVVSLAMTVFSFAFAFGGMVSLKVMRPSAFKRMGLIFSIAISLCIFLMSVIPSVAVYFILNAASGFLGGIYGTVLATVMINNWFLEKTGIFTSIAFGISGIMGAVFSPVLNNVIQVSGWQRAYMVMAVILLVLYLLPVLLPVAMRPNDLGLAPYGTKTQTAAVASSDEETVIVKKNVVLVVILAMAGAGTTALPTHFAGIAEAAGLTSAVGAFMISICMVMNTTGKVLLGASSDKFGIRKTAAFFLGLTAVGVALLLVSRTAFLMYIASAFTGLCYSVGAVGSAIATREVFGSGVYPKVYPMVSLATTVSSAVTTTLAGIMYDASGSYRSFIMIVLVLLAAGIYSSLALPEGEKK